MELLICLAEIGEKYYVKYNERIRACYFIGTKGYGEKVVYIADIAGVGVTEIPFEDRNKQFDEWYRGKEINSIFAESPEDLMLGKYVKALYGSPSNSWNTSLFKRFLPGLRWGESYSPFGFKFNKQNLEAEFVYVRGWNYWELDARGFHHDINLDDIYATKEECLADYAECFEPVEF